MKKYFKFKLLNISFWIVLVLAYVVPTEEKNLYGYPYKFFKIQTEADNNSLIFNSEFRILSFLINVIIIFIILNILYNIMKYI